MSSRRHRATNHTATRIVAHTIVTELLEERLLFSHFRYANLSWAPTTNANEVVFHFQEAFRRDYGFSILSGTPASDGNPAVGDVIDSGDSIDFADGTSTESVQLKVTFSDPNSDVLEGYAVDPTTGQEGILHTYAAAGNYTANISSGARLSTLKNNSDESYRAETIVAAGAGVSSPVSSLPPILNVTPNSVFTYQVPAADPNSGHTLNYRLSTATEAGDSGFVEPTGFTISPTGLITWDVRPTALSTTTGDLWNAQIMVEDHDASGNVVTKTPLDFLLQIGQPGNVNNPPVFDQIPASIVPVGGQPLSFTVQASDPDVGNTVTLQAINAPPGMTFAPTPTAAGSAPDAVALLAQWTPTVQQASQPVVLTFEARDQAGAATDEAVFLGPPQPPSAAAVDATFNGGQPVQFGFSVGGVALQSDGKFVVAGLQTLPGGNTQGVLERLNTDGSLDTTFGAGGMVTDTATADEAYHALTIQADGSIVAAGTSNGGFLLARYLPTGAADPSFGTAGRVVAATGSGKDVCYGVTTDSSGHVICTGTSNGQFAVGRFTSTGAADNSFNGGAPVLFSGTPSGTQPTTILGAVAVAPDGSIVAAGSSNGAVIVTRVAPTGILDPTFGAAGSTPGVVSIPGLAATTLGAGANNVPDYTEGLAVQSDGKILVANRTPGNDFGLARLNPDGSIDTAFGSGGLVTTDLGGSDDADLVTVTPDGSQIFVAGTSTSGGATQNAVVAYLPNGTVNTLFGNAGKLAYDASVPTATPTPTPTPTPAPTATPGAARPSAEGLGAIAGAIFGTLQSNGDLVLGASRTGGTANAASLRRLNAARVSPTPTPTPTPTDAQKVAADKAKLAADLKSLKTTIAAGNAAIRSVTRADNALIAADRKRIRADRGNPTQLTADKAQLAADLKKLKADVAAAKAELVRDKADVNVLIKADRLQLKTDQLQLRKDQRAGK